MFRINGPLFSHTNDSQVYSSLLGSIWTGHPTCVLLSLYAYDGAMKKIKNIYTYTFTDLKLYRQYYAFDLSTSLLSTICKKY